MESGNGPILMMRAIDLTAILLIPGGLAIAFLLWVLWNFHQDGRRR